ncbi:uncharacterized protein LOC100883896 isoform X1 [Megachile rotundata]|uniref:uncharacterized protein LOC100883896 isoform X1 n=1 Tax=Megachile rotundata TaxID=143995 RepID=UPI000614DB46|nr:PREDICTED: zinc finger CW-type PWWP domain protein 1-like isoform X1 [Megachile rotundata]
MQRKNLLFELSDLDQPTSTVLFKKSELEKFNLFKKLSDNTNILSFYTTPPMEKKPVPTPKAPIKQKNLPRKGDLKPKKLQYSDEESEISSAVDSGVYFDSIHSNNSRFCNQHTAKSNRIDSSQKQTRILRSTLGKIKERTDDKENDKNIVNYRPTNTNNSKNNVGQTSSVVFSPNTERLSFCDSNLNWKEVLYWLQPRRDVGLWIHCCRRTCKKLRYVDDYHDPIDVPKKWFCNMNSDKSIASCTIPEQPIPHTIKNDLIENIYNAGSIVWARISGFPWWPAMVNDCPDTFTYYELNKKSIKPVRYYVTFFNEERLESNWIPKANLKALATNKYSQLIKKTKFRGIEYKEPLEKAYKTALSALQLSLLERLRKYSFVAQYDKYYDDNNNINGAITQTFDMDIGSSDDEIPCSNFREHITLKEFYLNGIRRI